MSRYVVSGDLRQDQAEHIRQMMTDLPEGPWIFPPGTTVHDLDHGEFYETGGKLHIPDELALISIILNAVFLTILVLTMPR